MSTRNYPAHALKGGDVLVDGREVYDTEAINRLTLRVRTIDPATGYSAGSFRVPMDAPVAVRS